MEKWTVSGDFTGRKLFIGDINGDSRPEILLASLFGYTCFDSTGAKLWNISFQWADDNADISVNTDTATIYEGKGLVMEDIGGYLYFIGGDGNIIWKRAMERTTTYQILADVDGDGEKEIITARGETSTEIICLSSGDGSEEWNYTVQYGKPASPIIAADTDSDGKLELLMSVSGDDGAKIICFDTASADEEPAVPGFTAYMVTASLALAFLVVWGRRRLKTL